MYQKHGWKHHHKKGDFFSPSTPRTPPALLLFNNLHMAHWGCSRLEKFFSYYYTITERKTQIAYKEISMQEGNPEAEVVSEKSTENG